MGKSHLVRRSISAVAIALAALTLAPFLAVPAGAVTAGQDESEFLTKLNQERVKGGLQPLTLDTKLAATARDWSSQMASRNTLSHDPNLAADATAVEPNWRAVGENVGYGYSVQQLHDAFMGSSGHRANIMKPTFNRVGIGVVLQGSKIWVTVRFLTGPAITGTTGLGPPPGVRTALHGDFNGDGRSDLLTYGPGSAVDELWWGTGAKAMNQGSVNITGDWRPVAGDFDGDGKTEIFWYAPGDTQDVIWTWNGSGWSSRNVSVNGTYSPIAGDFDGDGNDDILWYAPGTAGDTWWYGNDNGSFSGARASVAGTYRPAVGDFDNRYGDDILWYGPGTAKDLFWYSTATRGSFSSVSISVGGSYKPFSGDFDGSGTDDVFWYAPGTSQDSTWFMKTTKGAFSRTLRTVSGTSYLPASDDYDGNQADDIVWFAPSSADGDPLWWSAAGSRSASPATV